jgi:hypothetical protein
MKPDIKLFKKLEDESKFISWKDHFITTCAGASLGECCDFTYIPTPQEQASFRNKDRWMYTVLMNIVKTPDGIDLIRKHRGDKSGRAVLLDMIQENAKSSTADIRSNELLQEITSRRLDSTWSKSVREFILEYEQLLEDYNESVRFVSQQLSPEMKRAMVERAVAPNRVLRDLKNRENDQIAQVGIRGRFDYRTYMYLLKEAAKSVDVERGQRNRGRRKANIHAIDDNSDEDDDDSLTRTLQAWVSRRVSGSRMNKETWSALDPGTQKIWDSIDDKDKAAILNYATKRAEKQSRSQESRQVNNHEGDHTSDSDDSSDTGEDSPNQEMEANLTKTEQQVNDTKGKTHPGDIRRVLSTGKAKDKTKPKPKEKSRSANHVMWNINNNETSTTMSDHVPTPSPASTTKPSTLGDHVSSTPSSSTTKGEHVHATNRSTKTNSEHGDDPIDENLPDLDDGEASSSDDGDSVFDPQALIDEYWGDQDDHFFP